MSAFDGAVFVCGVIGWLAVFLGLTILSILALFYILEAFISIWEAIEDYRRKRADKKKREKIYDN